MANLTLSSGSVYSLKLSDRDLGVIQKYLFAGSYYEVAPTLETISKQLEEQIPPAEEEAGE